MEDCPPAPPSPGSCPGTKNTRRHKSWHPCPAPRFRIRPLQPPGAQKHHTSAQRVQCPSASDWEEDREVPREPAEDWEGKAERVWAKEAEEAAVEDVVVPVGAEEATAGVVEDGATGEAEEVASEEG
eukprot:4118552-Prymnesium_polylepis.2